MDLVAPVGIPSPFSTFQIFVSRVMMPEFIVPIVLLNECALLVSGLFLEGIIFVLPRRHHLCSSLVFRHFVYARIT